MDKISIIGVPEHFNFPWLSVIADQPFIDEGITLEWSDEPKGSGAMNKAIREGRADIAIILTESFVKDKIEGNPGKIIGYHVRSPLIWGIHVSGKSQVESLENLGVTPFLISRFGSGSHLMAFLLAKKMAWDPKQLKFEVVGDLQGARSVLEGEDLRLFLWEKYMTKPLVDQGTFKRVGEIPSPWPCFVNVAAQDALNRYPDQLKKLQDLVYQKSICLQQAEEFPFLLSKEYGISESDIRAWLAQTEWATDTVVARNTFWD